MNGLAKKLSFKDDKEYIYTFIEARSEKIILAEELKEYINTFKDDEERKETLIYYIEISQITDRKNRLYEFIDNAPNQEQDFTDFYKTILY